MNFSIGFFLPSSLNLRVLKIKRYSIFQFSEIVQGSDSCNGLRQKQPLKIYLKNLNKKFHRNHPLYFQCAFIVISNSFSGSDAFFLCSSCVQSSTNIKYSFSLYFHIYFRIYYFVGVFSVSCLNLVFFFSSLVQNQG